MSANQAVQIIDDLLFKVNAVLRKFTIFEVIKK